MLRKRIGIRPALAGSIFSGHSLPTGAMHIRIGLRPMIEEEDGKALRMRGIRHLRKEVSTKPVARGFKSMLKKIGGLRRKQENVRTMRFSRSY